MIRRELGDQWGIGILLHNLGEIAECQGADALAQSLHQDSLAIARKLGDQRLTAYALEGFASAAASQGQAGHALRLAGAAAGLRESMNVPLSATEQDTLRRRLQSAWQALGETAGAVAWAEGQSMPLEEAVAHALAVLSRRNRVLSISKPLELSHRGTAQSGGSRD